MDAVWCVLMVGVYGFPSGSTQKPVPGYQDNRSVPGSSGHHGAGVVGAAGQSQGCSQAVKLGPGGSHLELKTGEAQLMLMQPLPKP